MVSSILLQNFKCIALKLEKINKGERFLCHMTTVCSFARCSYICFPLALETCYDLSSSSKCQGWKEAGFCTHPDHQEALIHWCPKTCYNCKFVYLGFLKRIFKPSFQYKIQSLTFSIFPRRTFIYLFIFKQTDGIGLNIEYLLLLRESMPPAKQSSCNYQGLVVRRPISA